MEKKAKIPPFKMAHEARAYYAAHCIELGHYVASQPDIGGQVVIAQDLPDAKTAEILAESIALNEAFLGATQGTTLEFSWQEGIRSAAIAFIARARGKA